MEQSKKGCHWVISKKGVAAVMACLLATILGGCNVSDIMSGIKEMEYNNGPFQNNLESARGYLLEQLQEKYEMEFFVVGNEKLENYGPLAGATYSCQVAPIDAPEQVTNALVSQTKFKNVRDNYAIYYFKEDAEAPVLALCNEKEYVLKQSIALEMPETDKLWSAEDELDQFLSQSGAYVRLTLHFEDNLDSNTYAEQILDFLHSIDTLNCNLFLQVKANETHIFFSEANILNGFDASCYTVESLVKRIEQRLKTGDPK